MKFFFNSFKTLLFGLAIIYLWGWVSLQFKYFDKYFGITIPRWLNIPGVFFMLIGGIIALTTAMTFVIYGKGTPAPFDAPREFVSSGQYKYVRNPMYIGGFLMFEGFALQNLSLSMTIFPFIWLIIVHLFVIFYEEKILEKKFGSSYLNYKQEVRRWLPKFYIKN